MWNVKLNELMWKRFLNSQTINNFLSVSFDNLPKTYVEYQPWITLIYIAIFIGPMLGFLLTLI